VRVVEKRNPGLLGYLDIAAVNKGRSN